MKLFLIVEGPSDEIIFRYQCDWLKSLGIEKVAIRPADGKDKMIRDAQKHYRTSISQGADIVIFLLDQDNDVCAMATRTKLKVESLDKACVIVVKRELEAWLLADGQCIRNTFRCNYHASGQTDSFMSPKDKLQAITRQQLGYPLTETEYAYRIAPHFSIFRAASNNTSAKRFKEFVKIHH